MPDRRLALRRSIGRTAAVLGARRVRAPVVVCWDLDNTLVDSGTLVRAGRPVADAWIEAGPVPGMLELAEALRAALPAATHVVLSVRPRRYRPATMAWLERYATDLPARATWLVSSPDDKPPVWRALARHSQLVVIDDLAGGHEGLAPAPYERLVEEARQIAAVYVGLAVIEQVRTTGAPDLPREIVAWLSR